MTYEVFVQLYNTLETLAYEFRVQLDELEVESQFEEYEWSRTNEVPFPFVHEHRIAYNSEARRLRACIKHVEAKFDKLVTGHPEHYKEWCDYLSDAPF